MEISQLRYLITIAEEGSFTQAARRLKLSQPSLSLAIKKLEDELGQPLFDRLTRKVVPTEAGERLLDSARRVLADLERTANEVREMRGEVTGVLRIGAIPTIGPFLLPELIDEFSKKFPQVKLHITEEVTSRLIGMIERGEIDVALVSMMDERPGIHSEQIGTESLLVLTPDIGNGQGEEPISWEELESEKLLMLGDEHCLAEQVQKICRKNRLSGRTIMEGTQLTTIAAMVNRGLGISLVPAMMAEQDYAKGCSYRKVKNNPPSRPLFIAWSVVRFRTQAAREFAKLVKSKTAEMPFINNGVAP